MTVHTSILCFNPAAQALQFSSSKVSMIEQKRSIKLVLSPLKTTQMSGGGEEMEGGVRSYDKKTPRDRNKWIMTQR